MRGWGGWVPTRCVGVVGRKTVWSVCWLPGQSDNCAACLRHRPPCWALGPYSHHGSSHGHEKVVLGNTQSGPGASAAWPGVGPGAMRLLRKVVRGGGGGWQG